MQQHVKISQWQEARDDLASFMKANKQKLEAMDKEQEELGRKDSWMNSGRDLWRVAPRFHPLVSIGTDWWIMLTRAFVRDCIKEIDKQNLRKAA